MRGTIIQFDEAHGLISGLDGKRYSFSRSDWAGNGEPYSGASVDFVEQGDNAKNIFPLLGNNKYSKLVLAVVCWFFGILGVHRFMVGKVGTGIVMMLLTFSVFGIFISAIWSLVDFIVILMGNFTDKYGNKIERDGF